MSNIDIYEYMESNNILYTEITTNTIDEYFYDIYIKEEDYLKHKEVLDKMKNFIKKEICEIVFYAFENY